MVTANMGSEKPPVVYKKGLVKFINSGDSITLITNPKTRDEVNFIFSSVTAPKLARRPRQDGPPSAQPEDAPYAWEAREFLRQRIIGKIVYYTVDKNDGNRCYGTVFYPEKENSITELMISEGWVDLRGGNPVLAELENRAKENGKGKHSPDEPGAHVRKITWDPEPKQVLDKFGKKITKAVIDNINQGLTMRAFLLPEHYYVAFSLSGIKIVRQEDEYGPEVRQYLEERILQRDVNVIIESIQNEKNKVMNATLIHEGQKMNIGELLVREGFASCNTLLQGVYDEKKLREAEKKAQSEKKRKWAHYVPKKPPKERQAVVHEIINGDALMIKYVGDTKEEKVFLSSIRPPRPEGVGGGPSAAGEGGKPPVGRSKPLYDVPWLYEAREFLRTRLIGKKVTISEDYTQDARDKFPEKKCVSVFVGQENIAEALLSKGLATCVRYREDEENKSPHYEKLRQAEDKAEKSLVGVWAKKDVSVHRVNDVSTDGARAKAMFPSLQRFSSIEGVVEFVASGSRFRIYIDRETCLITFLLGGIDCPRASRPAGPNTKDRIPSEEFGEEALDHVKKLVLQRTVELKVETMDKRGGMIGWMFVNGVNLSIELVEQGFARVHETAERSVYARQLKQAEENAKALKLRRWENYKEEDELAAAAERAAAEESAGGHTSNERADRTVNYIEAIVCVVEAATDLSIYCQKVSEAPKIDSLMSRLRQEFTANPPVLGAYTPRRNDICAARFPADQEWYRAKVEKVQGNKANIFYIDYGNKETAEFSELTFLPEQFKSEPGYAHEYRLAFTKQPPEDYRPDSIHRLEEEIENRKVLLNVEYNITGSPYVTVLDASTKTDLIKALIAAGYFLVETRRDKRLQKLVGEYEAAQQEALKNRYNMWEYGDIREDDDKDFRR
uniref:Staphylococcal nuclease domain-containing protein 1 n=1 Tax=Cacopsylla melanoneura TaxID=428564 RepID=A0A8D9BSS8_9HEMI